MRAMDVMGRGNWIEEEVGSGAGRDGLLGGGG